MKYCFFSLLLLTSGCIEKQDAGTKIESRSSVVGNVVSSTGFPRGSISVDSSFSYVDSEAFILYGNASCEIHVFVAADSTGLVERLYWIQYEAYLPGLIPRRYDYSDEPYRVTYDGREFFEGVNFYNVPDDRPTWRAGSDIGHVFDLLKRNGYSMEVDVMRVRQVHLDDSRKKELMIIYLENLETQGMSVESFGREGRSSEAWIQTSEGLRERAKNGLSMSFD